MADEDSTILAEDSTLVDKEQPSFISGVTNALGLLAGLQAVGATLSSFTDIFNTVKAPQNFIVPDLANNGSQAIGFRRSAGGIFGTPHMVNTITPRVDDSVGSAGKNPGSWEALDFIINRALGMDWITKNADPGNPNILEAYRFAGRNFTKDGGTGELSWAAAFATWVLVKSGFNGLRTMSPIAFEKYGTPVRFHKGPLTDVKKWDIFVFSSNANIHHVGFIKSYDPKTQIIEIVGGDQADRVKVTRMPFSITNPQFRVTHVRRNWTPPESATILSTTSTRQTQSIFPTISTITVQSLPPIGASEAEIAEFNRRNPPVPTSRPTVQDISRLATSAIERAEQTPPAPTRPRTGPQ